MSKQITQGKWEESVTHDNETQTATSATNYHWTVNLGAKTSAEAAVRWAIVAVIFASVSVAMAIVQIVIRMAAQ